MTEEQRPPRRDKQYSLRVDQETLDLAKDKLEKINRGKPPNQRRSLAAILRAFLLGWALDEYPDPPELPDERTRAKKQPKK